MRFTPARSSRPHPRISSPAAPSCSPIYAWTTCLLVHVPYAGILPRELYAGMLLPSCFYYNGYSSPFGDIVIVLLCLGMLQEAVDRALSHNVSTDRIIEEMQGDILEVNDAVAILKSGLKRATIQRQAALIDEQRHVIARHDLILMGQMELLGTICRALNIPVSPNAPLKSAESNDA
ncbi:hypothetical protein EVG20_g9827 [Dentipellis fragilis]|uniref:Uncharacterized protein n=1 Tax=Dentipellis fragilis TaxID=205917 RepID=A0A4Y9XV67_9AGAM|nr:hypothetical protein EVG20_g9827 [Dentipellis fragilis]